VADDSIRGRCDARFEPVREAFLRNFAERDDLGAAVAVTVGGEPVVDLWGGWGNAARTRPWEEDTIVPVWSLGKAATSVCLLRLVDAGRVELDAPAARYWPEFAQAGKQAVTVRQLLAHQAGLPAVRKPLAAGLNITDWDGMTAALAEQEPWWEPGTRFGYHVNTHGHLVGEVLRCVDGRTVGTYLREEVAGPMGVDFIVGLPASEDGRVAEWLNYAPVAGYCDCLDGRVQPDTTH